MRTLLLLTTILTTSTLALAADHSAERQVITTHILTLDGARQAGFAAEAFAKTHGATPSIAVVDAAGTLLYFARLDGSFPAAAEVSLGKARTAARFRKPTREFEDIVNHGRFTMTALPDFTPLQGGVPIVHNGEVIGAVGVSGAKSAAQDEEVAEAAARVIADAAKTAAAK